MLRYVASMPVRNKLNVKQIEGLRKPGVYSDGGGLYLRVRPKREKETDTESDRKELPPKSWVYIATRNERRHELGLGSYYDVPLAAARQKAEEMRALLLQGRDPREARPLAKAVDQTALTFGKFALTWLDDVEDGFSNPKHRQQWRNTLKTYAASIWEMPLADVATEHVLDILKPIWLTKADTAGRVRGRIERVIDAAKVKGLYQGENPARGRGHLDLMLPRRGKVEVKHHTALAFREMKTFMADLARRPGIAAQALQFTILTAARSGETRGMSWGEIDFDQNIWTVPSDRMKARATHQVPLSAAALAILNAVKPNEPKPDQIVFSAPRGGALSDMTLSAVLKRMDRPVTVHGFRSSFRDWAGDSTQHEREVVELALAHTIASATERAYRRGRALDKRRDLMKDWADYCSEPSP